MLLMRAFHHLPSPLSFHQWPGLFKGPFSFSSPHVSLEQKKKEKRGWIKHTPVWTSALWAGVGSPHSRFSSSATALPRPHRLLSRAGVLPAGAPDISGFSPLILPVSVAQGKSEISLSVMTDTTFKAATATPRGFASHLLVRRNEALCCAHHKWHRHYSSPRPLPTGGKTGKQNSFKRISTSCSLLLAYKNNLKPGKPCQGAACIVLHLQDTSIPAGPQAKELGWLRVQNVNSQCHQSVPQQRRGRDEVISSSLNYVSGSY